MELERKNDPSPGGDRPDRESEASTPAQPMVVIHYRNRGVPLWVLIPLILAIPIGGILVYHQLFVEADRADAMEATRILRERMTKKRIDAPISGTIEPPVPLVLDSRPTLLPTANPHGSASTTNPPSDAGRARAPSETPHLPKAPESAVVSSYPDADQPASTIAVDAVKSQVPSNRAGPSVTVVDVGMAPATVSDPAAKERATSEAVKDGSRSAGDGSENPVALDQDLPSASALPPSPPPARDDQQAMPSPEHRAIASDRSADASESTPAVATRKSVRQNQQELARKRAEMELRLHEERVQFRRELKDALALNIKQVGPEIDKLSRRYGRDCDPSKFNQARNAWFFTRTSAAAKVRLIRSLGLPESVILDFICADLHPHIGSRGGPRDTNDVRVRAARRLLSYELPAPPSATGASEQPSPADESSTDGKP